MPTTARCLVLSILACLATPARGQAVLGTLPGAIAYDSVGQHVEMMGDLDGDGCDDLALGSGGGGSEPGVVTLLSGASLSTLATITGASSNDKASAVARLGDLDGDGLSDIAIGSWGSDIAGNESGAVRIYSSATTALLHTLPGPYSGARFGWAVASAGDVDGDGKDDLLVGAPGNGMPARVRTYSTGTWSLLLDIPGDGSTGGLGRNVASIGDQDGDGVREVVTGCEDSNRVLVWSGLDGTALLLIDGLPGAKLGGSVAGIGDVNDDGYEDFAAGGADFDTVGLPSSGNNAGLMWACSGLDGSVLSATYGLAAGNLLGRTVAGAGDVDNDGTPDVAVAAPKVEYLTLERGEVSVHSGTDGARLGQQRGDIDATSFGIALAGGGDLDGDGWPDLAVGSPNDDVGPTPDTGRLTCLSFRFRLHDAVPCQVLFTQPGSVALLGGGFDSGSPIAITLDGVPATNVQWISGGLVTFDAPAGAEDTLADLVYSQDGESVVVPDAIAYEGARVVDITPDVSPMTGAIPVTLWGENFVDDGSNVVNFMGATATITNVDAPDRIDVVVPVYTPQVPNPGWDVELTSSTGTWDVFGGFRYLAQFASPGRGNIAGGTPVTLFGVPGHLIENVTVTMGASGPQAQVVSVGIKQISILTPAVPEPIDAKYGLYIHDAVGGNVSLGSQFFYTPWLGATYEQNAFRGGTLTLRWVTDPAVVTSQPISLWMANPFSLALSKTLPGYAGILRAAPDIFLFMGLPEPAGPQLLHLHVPPLEASLSGLHLRFQSLVGGEGGPKGSFTNLVDVKLP